MRRFSWIFGVLGLLAILFIVFWKKFFGDWTAITWAIGGVGAALIGLWSWLDRGRIESAAGSRSVRYSSGAFALVVVALGIAVAANVLGVRYDHRWDATSTKQFTLSEQSKKIAEGLEREVQVMAFFPADAPDEASFRSLMDGYKQETSLLSIEYHDPIREPFLAQQFEITSQYGTVVLVSGKDKKRLESKFDEEAFTNALIQLTSGREHDICFTTDHGEMNPDDESDPLGLGFMVMKLEGQNYKVDKLSILKEGGVPSRCEVMVVAAPQADLLPVEREAVARYIKEGGRVFMMLQPLAAEATAADLVRYGLKVGNDLVLEDNPEARRIGLDPTFLLIGKDGMDFHPITNDLKAGILLQMTRSIGKLDSAPVGLNVQILAHSSAASWAETTLDGSVPAQPDEGKDIVGNVPLMAAVEVADPSAIHVGDTHIEKSSLPVPLASETAKTGAATAPESAGGPAESPSATPSDRKGRLVVIGDGHFAENQLAAQGMNQDLFLNTVAWLAGEENQVSIRSNEAAKGTLQVNMAQGAFVWLASLLLIPGAAIGAAITLWMRRRSQ
jgi:hypothetical protein